MAGSFPESKVAGVKRSRQPEFFGPTVPHVVAICSVAIVGGLATLERKFFGDISPFTYAIAVKRQILQRMVRNVIRRSTLATSRDRQDLPVVIYRHSSLIRRKLGNVDLLLQENKAVSLGLAAPHIDGILIKPSETFSFWHLVGHCPEKKGYKTGMTVSSNGPASGIGGGLCQFTNLLHWMVLHSPLEIVEHHHHGAIDLFPDFNRQIPFGTGTSIVYDYLDYRVRNPTQSTFQFRLSLSEEHLRGELRATEALGVKFHVKEAESYFQEVGEAVYRRNLVYRNIRDKRTGNEITNDLIVESNAKVLYDRELINAPVRPDMPVAAGH